MSSGHGSNATAQSEDKRTNFEAALRLLHSYQLTMLKLYKAEQLQYRYSATTRNLPVACWDKSS